MVYVLKNNTNTGLKPSQSTFLLFDESLSISDVDASGIIVIVVLLVLYIVLLIWSFIKDRSKQSFAPQLEGKDLQISTNKSDNLREIQFDYTAETIEMTTVTTEEMRDYSSVLNTQGDTSMTSTPNAAHSRSRSFRFDRASKRRSTTPKSGDISADGRMHSDMGEGINLERDMMAANLPPISDESIFRTTKRESRRRNNGPTAVVKKRQTIASKFSKLLEQRHIIISTIKRMSRISPRWKRVGLIFFLLNCDMFLCSMTYLDLSMKINPVREILIVSFLSWIIFAGISRLSAVSKDKLKEALTTQDFQKSLYAIEQESLFKNICLQIILSVFLIFSFIQFGLFATNFKENLTIWIITSVGVFLIQVILFEIIAALLLASIYVKAYSSRCFRKIYRICNSLRFWKI